MGEKAVATVLDKPSSSLANRPPASGLVRDLAVARRVIRAEIEGLEQLSQTLDAAFGVALDLCAAARGRLIVTGIGKSGHVGRKIAATLASTGTPAQFVHPAEASHGDLGMIGVDDAILALSNSGESAELADIIFYSRRFKIPLIAITGGRGSTLAEAADVVLPLPVAAEACPMGLAPTTSTTMMLGLGDALAVALMERRGFSEEEYRTFHPGGQIGRVLLKVSDVMHGAGALPLVKPDRPMSEAIIVMTQHGFGCAGVVNAKGRLVGIVTDGDLRRHMGPSLMESPVETVMTHAPKTIGPDALAAEALGLMNMSDKPFTAMFVVADAKPIGIVSVHDLLRAGVM